MSVTILNIWFCNIILGSKIGLLCPTKMEWDRSVMVVKALGAKGSWDVHWCKVAHCVLLSGIIWTVISSACTACMKCAQLTWDTHTHTHGRRHLWACALLIPYVQAKAVFAEHLRDKASELMQTYSYNPVFSPSNSPHLPSLSSNSFCALQLPICDRLGQITGDYFQQIQPLHVDHGHPSLTPPLRGRFQINNSWTDWLRCNEVHLHLFFTNAEAVLPALPVKCV